jgi:hypothetical protein
MLIHEPGARSGERVAGIFYTNFFDFLLQWPGRPITMGNETLDL